MTFTEQQISFIESQATDFWTNPNNGMTFPLHYATVDDVEYRYEFCSDGSIMNITIPHPTDPVEDTMCEQIMSSDDYAILVAAVEAKVMSDLIKSQTRHLMESDDYNPDLYKNIVIAIADGCLDSSQDSVERAFTFNNHSELGLFVRASVCAYWEVKAFNKVKGEVE